MCGVYAGLFRKNLKQLALTSGLVVAFWSSAWAKKAPPAVRTGVIRNDGALIYKNPDFDSKVIAQLAQGKSYPISSKTVGAFFKIKVRDGIYGYIADTDIKALLTPDEKKIREKKSEAKSERSIEEKEAEALERRNKKFVTTRFRGLQYQQISYKENTMGGNQTDSMGFYGFKFSGPGVLADQLYTEANILLHFGAPQYYAEKTGQSASGFGLLMNFLWEIEKPEGKNVLLFFGLGPMIKYSKWDVTLVAPGKVTSSNPNPGNVNEPYTLNDIGFGLTGNLGVALKMGRAAVRLEAQYYLEKNHYLGLGAAVQLPF